MPATSVARPAATSRPSGRDAIAASDELATRTDDARPNCASSRPWRAKPRSSAPAGVRRATNARSPPSRALARPAMTIRPSGSSESARAADVAWRIAPPKPSCSTAKPSRPNEGSGTPMSLKRATTICSLGTPSSFETPTLPATTTCPFAAIAIAAGPVPSGRLDASPG